MTAPANDADLVFNLGAALADWLVMHEQIMPTVNGWTVKRVVDALLAGSLVGCCNVAQQPFETAEYHAQMFQDYCSQVIGAPALRHSLRPNGALQ
jgi:hypothetical protein